MKGNFQLILIVVFIFFAIFGILVFSGTIPIGKEKAEQGSGGTVVLWGTVKSDSMHNTVQEFNDTFKLYNLKYEQKSAATFNQDLLEALASGKGPDLFFLPDYLAYDYSNKIFTIPYSSYPLATFKNTFAGAGEVFLTSGGILAFPIAIDPIVMYYNRSTLNSNGIVYPPANWSELNEMAPLLTKVDDSRLILKSAVAMGQYTNITNAKHLITALFLQTGNNMVRQQDNRYVSTMADTIDTTRMLDFYTNFSNPLAKEYSWNKALDYSQDAFSAENLALYFGFASELGTLVNKNPNQDFLAALIPQIKNASNKATSARVTGIAISKFSKNFNSAISVANLLANSNFALSYSRTIGAPPARRDLLAQKPVDSFFPVFYDSALFARSWLDPSPAESDGVFRRMVENVLSNTLPSDASIRDAGNKINNLYLK